MINHKCCFLHNGHCAILIRTRCTGCKFCKPIWSTYPTGSMQCGSSNGRVWRASGTGISLRRGNGRRSFMRNYQKTKNNPYHLPQNLYMRMLYLIRDYDRIRAERQEILHSSPDHDGVPVSGFGSPTESKAMRMYAISRECEAVEKALRGIPEVYRDGVLNNICHRTPFPIDAGEATYQRWRSRLVYYVAKNCHLV